MKAAIVLLVSFGLSMGLLGQSSQLLKSPNGKLHAVVKPARNQNVDESRVSIFDSNGKRLRTHNFSSPDGEHGYGADEARNGRLILSSSFSD